MGFFGDPQSRGLGIFKIWGYLSPGIGDFWKSGDFYPGDFCLIPGIFAKSPGFISPSPGIFWGFLSPGFFGDGDFSGMGIYFRGIGIFHQKVTSNKLYYLFLINLSQRKLN